MPPTPPQDWPEPSADGAAVIERIYRLAALMHQFDLPGRPALIISVGEAFTLLDQLRAGPWQLTVPMPPGLAAAAGPRTTRYDLTRMPEPGMAWATVFGVTLIIEEMSATQT